MPILDAAGVDLVLSGHSHSYERSLLIDGHYGASGSLAPGMILDGGDGKISGDGAYVKPGAAGTPNEGAVHVVVGSSGKTEDDGPLNHPVMEVSMLTLGSLVLDISGNQLDAAFIDSAGDVQDEFTIIKSPPQVVAIDVDPWSDANEVKPASTNPIVVAALGMSIDNGDAIDFDASMVDPATLKLGLGEAPNVSIPWIMDVNGDSETDMVLAFTAAEAGIFCSDTEISLSGATLTGEEFVGTDTIQPVDCEDEGCHP
jgi:hypothetical protein